jgi:hypothetical protein
MLKNFIIDEDLKNYHPNLNRQIWNSQSDYNVQIVEAYNNVLTDLYNKGVNPRQLQMPFNLVSNTASYLSNITKTASVTGDSFAAGDLGDRNYQRLVVNVNAIDGEFVFSIDGSNDNTNFDQITSITASVAGERSIKFNNQYKFYRYRALKVSGTTTTFTTYLVETVWDNLIIYRSFEIIFSDFRKSQNDSWDLLVQQYAKKYDGEINAAKYLFDADDDGTIADGEEQASNRYYLEL